jgi:transposase
MSIQNITPIPALQEPSRECPAREAIVVPLDLPAFRILRQEVQADGSIEVEVMGTDERACCPQCGRMCAKVHDRRLRRKRDRSLRDHQVVLVVHKPRFKCFGCRRSFTEPDQACGRYRRTTVHLRKLIGEQASLQPIAHVARAFKVGPRFVQVCLEMVAEPQLAKRGRSRQESAMVPTPRSSSH